MRISRRIHRTRKRLWAGWSVLALLILTIFVSSFFQNADTAESHRGMGLDFVAFYRAGYLLQSGNTDALYDLNSTQQFDRALSIHEQLPLGEKFGPFFNPPFFAWVYEPLVRLGYEPALLAWTVISLGCFSAAACLLARMIPSTNWKYWGLVPALMVTSLPFLQTMGHAQNSCLSLLIATGAVTAWRMRRPLLAGMVGGLLIYKPQLAAVLLLGMAISLGLKALRGAAISCMALCIVNVATLPGTLNDYIHRIGPNVQYMMSTHPYIWGRHVTFRAFWQMLLNHSNPAATSKLTTCLSVACAMALGITLLVFAWRGRRMASPDRLIAAVMTTAPLLMPYYLDYDLLLLAIPVVLLAAEMVGKEPARLVTSRDRWLIRLWIALYLLLLINPGLTATIGINLCVPLLASIATISILRIRREQTVLIATPMDDYRFDSLSPVFAALAS